MKLPAKLLIADIDPAILSATRRAPEAAGYTTLAAPDGETALRLAQAQRPDLALLDGNLPGLGGFEVCRRLKADPSLSGVYGCWLCRYCWRIPQSAYVTRHHFVAEW
jgi:CheY-like chemotaxis protein